MMNKFVALKKGKYFWLIFSFLFSLFLEWMVFPEEPISWIRVILVNLVLLCCYFVIKIVSHYNLEKKIICKNIKINKIFIIICSILGITFSILIPLHEIPDEITHINMTYEERNISKKFVDVNEGYYGDPKIQLDNNSKIDKQKYFDFTKKIDVKDSIKMPNILIVRHFPQWIAMVIGESLKLPVILYLALIELFSLIFYILLCNKALKKMPIKKPLFMACMLLPVCLQQMGSTSYDVVLLPFCFLYIASIFNLKLEKEKINLKDILSLMLYITIISICKIPYFILILLIFLLPIDKINIKIFNYVIDGKKIKNSFLKNKLLYILIMIAIIIIGLFLSYKVLMKISYGRILIGSVLHFGDTIHLYLRSIKLFFVYYNDSIFGNLGIFNIKTSLIFESILYLAFIFISFFSYKIRDNNEIVVEEKLKVNDKIIIYITALIMGYLIILSMFSWTLYVSGVETHNNLSMSEVYNYLHSLSYIGGVQGRYFIPLIPLIFIPLGNTKIYKHALNLNPIIYQIFYYLIIFLYFGIFLLLRFWI